MYISITKEFCGKGEGKIRYIYVLEPPLSPLPPEQAAIGSAAALSLTLSSFLSPPLPHPRG